MPGALLVGVAVPVVAVATPVLEVSEANIDEFRRAVWQRADATPWQQIVLPPAR